MALNCPVQDRPMFLPAVRGISAITQANPMQVITVEDHLYITGIIVRLVIPFGYSMDDLNQVTGPIIVDGANTFTMDIDTTQFPGYTLPLNANQCAQVVPIAEVNEILTAAFTNVLPYRS